MQTKTPEWEKDITKEIESLIIKNSFNPVAKYVIDDSHALELAKIINKYIKEVYHS